MKKILILFLSLFLFTPAFGKYIPIEKSQREQYRKEMRQVIDTKVPIYQKQMVELFDEFKEEQKQSIIKTNEDYSCYGIEFFFAYTLI